MNNLCVEDCQSISILELGLKNPDAVGIEINGQFVLLSKSKCNFGGTRPWFICPNCKCRVGKLYRKPFSMAFLCRHCQNLTYQLIKYRRSRHEPFLKCMHKLSTH